jgi:SAM-dependent methyltransferase
MIERARSFGMVAREYDRGRPGYPAPAIEWLLGPEPLDVVDLGAGTGKLTEALIDAGHRVVAVEPLAEMRELLLAARPDVSVVDATAEDTTLPDSSADAVVAGAAFHWFDTPRVFPEIARILRPPGVLGLFGNRFDAEAQPWVERLAGVVSSRRGSGRPRWPEPEQMLEWFVEVDEASFSHEQSVSPSTLMDLAQSYSRVALLAESDRQELLARVAHFWQTDPDLRDRDLVMLPWRTTARRCRELRRR